MEYKSPLSQRIIISFVLLTTIVSGLFSLGIILAIDVVEENLITTELNQEFSVLLSDYRKGQPLHLESGSRLIVGSENLPAEFLPMQPGFNEFELEQGAYHVLMRQEGSTSLYLFKEQTAFEQHEDIFMVIVIAGFLMSVLASVALGLLLVNKIIAPVKRLTRQVRNREKLLSGAPQLADGYADDEVGHLARAFDRTISMLQEALQRETLFTNDVSHELRTPLMVIKSSCDLLIEKGQLDDFSQQRIDSIGKAAREIQELVDAFLTLARGKHTEQEQATLSVIVQRNTEEWQRQAAAKQIAFVLEDQTCGPATDEPLLPAAMLRTVLNNLVRNAIHHTAEGRVTLIVRSGGVCVCDTGHGISAIDKQSIFKPFYRGESGSAGGLGLGLSLVQRICQREQWSIAVSDNHPAGCCFSISFDK